MTKKITVSLAIWVACFPAGCNLLVPDQPRYTDNVYWVNARVVEYPPEAKDKWWRIEATNGSRTVLLLKSGYYRSRTTTAHSSHGSFFMLLPQTLVVGKTYKCGPTDGTLRYSGFHGYDFSYMHLGRPAGASVEVLALGKDTIKAKVEAYCEVVNGRPGVADANDISDWPRPEHRKDVFTFSLTNLSERKE